MTGEQLNAAGVSTAQRRRALVIGMLAEAARGIYLVSGTPATWRQRLWTAHLGLGPASWVSHESAAALHGLDRTKEDSVELSMARGDARRCHVDAIVHRSREVRPSDIVEIAGLRCSSATRAVLELANAGVGPARLGAVIDSTVRLRLSSPFTLTERLATYRKRGRTGVRLIDHLLIDSGGESPLERRFLAVVRDAGLPRPLTQQRIDRDGHTIARADFVYPELRLVIEVSGSLGHSSPSERARDAQRRNELQELGYSVLEYTSSQIFQQPLGVASSLRARLRRPA